MSVSVKPGSAGHRALTLIARNPGELTSDDIAAHLWPRPRRTSAFPPAYTAEGRRAYAEWRKALTEHDTLTRARASRLVRYLAHAGYCESRGAPTLADWFCDRAARFGMETAIRRARPGPLSYGGSVEAHLRLVQRVTEGPGSVADVLGRSPSGHVKRAWRELERWGVVIPPRRRWVTPKGQEVADAAV